MSHTPTPWFHTDGIIYALTEHPSGIGGSGTCNRFMATISTCNGKYGAPPAEIEANTKLVVRAVNAHQELVDALDWYVKHPFEEAPPEIHRAAKAALDKGRE